MRRATARPETARALFRNAKGCRRLERWGRDFVAARTISIVDDYAMTGVSGQGFVRFLFSRRRPACSADFSVVAESRYRAAIPFLSIGGRYFSDGLYAHMPSRYTFDLGGQWKTFSAEAGIQSGGSGSALFVVKADGRELYRSTKIKDAKTVKIAVDVTGAKTLELATEDAGEGNRSAWSIWCDPRLGR